MTAEVELAHGWRLDAGPASVELVREFVVPAVAAIPAAFAARLGPCRIVLAARLGEPSAASRWTRMERETTIEIATESAGSHDAAMELLLCAGQILWETARPAERQGYLRLLAAETEAGVEGEIDEDALREKRRLRLSAASARNIFRLERYARASFAHTAAEYVHCLWHEVTARTGPGHLPGFWLRRRLEALALWYPPNPGYSLFAGE